MKPGSLTLGPCLLLFRALIKSALATRHPGYLLFSVLCVLSLEIMVLCKSQGKWKQHSLIPQAYAEPLLYASNAGREQGLLWELKPTAGTQIFLRLGDRAHFKNVSSAHSCASLWPQVKVRVL